LITSEQKAQEDFDKTVVSLSGGALGISFAFIKDIIGDHPINVKWALIASWICWGISITSVLFSYFTSHLALRKSIRQFDEAVKDGETEKIYTQRPGGIFSLITAILNALGGLLFFTGVALITIFVWYNMEAR
jgi:hypothetical protein